MTQPVSEILLKDDALCLLKEMVDYKPFNSYFSLKINSRKNRHADFTKNPVVLCIQNAIENMGKIQQDTKEQLVSLLVENYPKEWINSLISVGCTTVDNATDKVLDHVLGAAIPHLKKSMTRPGKRTGYEEIFFIEWGYRK